MTKADLRKQFLAERKALSAEEVDGRSRAIAERFFFRDVIFPNKIGAARRTSLSIHTFLPIVRQNEVNTWPITHRLWQEFPEIRVSASVTDRTSQTLTHYPLTPDTPLVENRWGIPEPLPTAHCLPPTTFDVVLVPLLAFDLHGHRVGYGGGYYDRFLAQCRPDCLKIGLSLFEPVDRIGDVEETDVPLSICITPEWVFTF